MRNFRVLVGIVGLLIMSASFLVYSQAQLDKVFATVSCGNGSILVHHITMTVGGGAGKTWGGIISTGLDIAPPTCTPGGSETFTLPKNKPGPAADPDSAQIRYHCALGNRTTAQLLNILDSTLFIEPDRFQFGKAYTLDCPTKGQSLIPPPGDPPGDPTIVFSTAGTVPSLTGWGLISLGLLLGSLLTWMIRKQAQLRNAKVTIR